MDFINENVIKCLKQEIDAYRDKYAIALQEIKELNYFSKEDNKELKAENDELKRGLFTSDVDEFKAELKALRSKEWDMQAEIKELKADITHDAKVSYDLDDKHVVIIKELEEENESLKSNSLKHSSLKEYKQEAEEYFHHNPKAKSVSFYMLDDCDVDEIDGSQHDPIVIIYNEGSN